MDQSNLSINKTDRHGRSVYVVDDYPHARCHVNVNEHVELKFAPIKGFKCVKTSKFDNELVVFLHGRNRDYVPTPIVEWMHDRGYDIVRDVEYVAEELRVKTAADNFL